MLTMVFRQCDYKSDFKHPRDKNDYGFCIALWQMYVVAAVGFVMLVTILVLSILLCWSCKRTKKKKLLELATENPKEEPELHYAELQNLPVSSRGQCDGGTCATPPSLQTSYYASVAELKGADGEGCSVLEEQEDYGLDDGQKEDNSSVDRE